ncbi:SpaA isopeptide-forming pilin-related protein [Lacrimispora sp.]|uniref:DUF7601 domain-containing protein n=1 Tax=Lacrimispora sp. TaxID=2719234 RepID=UPI0034606C70
MKRRKRRQLMSWLLATLLVLNVLLPATTVQADVHDNHQEMSSDSGNEGNTTDTQEDEADTETTEEGQKDSDNGTPSGNEGSETTPGGNDGEEGTETTPEDNNGEEGSNENENTGEGNENTNEDNENTDEGNENTNEDIENTDEGNENTNEDNESTGEGAENGSEDNEEQDSDKGEGENADNDNEKPSGENNEGPVADPVTPGPAPAPETLAKVRTLANNVTEEFEKKATIKVGDAEIAPGGDLSINDGDEVLIRFDFTGIPVPRDGSGVNPGDEARIIIGKGLKFTTDTPIELTVEGEDYSIGHVEFAEEYDENDDAILVAYIHFEWDWDQIPEDTLEFNAGFEIDLQYSKEDAGTGSNNEKIITILGSKYYVKDPLEFELRKTGTPSIAEKKVTWQVTVESNPEGSDLGGFTFSDDLSKVGGYKENSFKVLGIEDQQPDNDSTATNLKYTFPDGIKAPQIIQFETEIWDTDFNSNAEKIIRNTAKIKATSSDAIPSNEAKVTLPGKRWIEKEGKLIKTGDDLDFWEIEWTIVANKESRTLTNVTITDILGSNHSDKQQEVISIKYTIQGQTEVTLPISQTSLSFDELSAPITITVRTRIPNDADGIFENINYTNRATIKWDGSSKDGASADASVGIGERSLQKDGKKTSDHRIEWTVKFDPQPQRDDFTGNLKIYDLLVHGTNADDIALPEGTPDILQYAKTNQMFKAWISQPTGATVTPIYKDNKHVADLLIVPIADHTQSTSFKFQSQIVDHEIYANNQKTNKIQNTAVLYNGTTRMATATKEVEYESNILRKGVLKFDAGEDPGISGNAGTDGNGFNHKTRTATFRLDVNTDGLDLTGLSGGSVTVTDVLPEGWTFDKTFNDNNGYKIVKATGSEATLAITAEFKPEGDSPNEVSFTFTALNEHYVILVRAKLSEETYKEYLENTNGEKRVTNTATISFEKWDFTPAPATQDVIVKAQILKKGVIKAPTSSSRSLTWQVNYQPFDYDLRELDDYKDLELIDELHEGLELPTTNTGVPIWENITITKMVMGADGNYTDQSGEGAALDPRDFITYDSATRTLTFKIPDNNQAYRLTYVTHITLEGDGTVNNSVKLKGIKDDIVNTGGSFKVQHQKGWSNIYLGGYVMLTKVDGFDQALLEGAEFSLIAEDGTVIRKGRTDSSGKYRISAIPAGTYTLQETDPPEGYTPSGKTYRIVVTSGIRGKIITTIDGQEIEGNNLTVENFKSDDFGRLTFRKTVAGNGGDRDREFIFTVNLPGTEVPYNYIGSGVPNGSIRDGGTITLKHGQIITIYGLQAGTEYSVTEADYSQDGYEETRTGESSGTILADGVREEGQIYEVVFTNTRTLPGDLVISKTVLGTGADRTKKFEFTITFNADGRYPYSGPGVPEGATIASGEKITLADGESATITGLPDGTVYKVTEADYSSQRYTTVSTNAEGTIETKSSITAAFTNTYRRRSSSGGGGNPSGPRPGTPLVTIEGNVPTGNISGPQEEPEQLVNIEGNIPLAGLPKTGDSMFGVHAALILFIFSAGMGIFAFSILLRKQEEE